MSRLCRLKTKTHGDDGKWAHEEINRLRARIAELESQLSTPIPVSRVYWQGDELMAELKPCCKVEQS